MAAGAGEIDMVIDIGAAVAGDVDAVRSEIAAVRAAVPGAVLKVIVESAALLTLADEQLLVDVCRAAEDAEADFVKTSTGFHPAGGASVAAVALMADTVGGRLGVKASGGIRTAADALAMLDAGATRLGLSGTRAVLDGLDRARASRLAKQGPGAAAAAGRDGGVAGRERALDPGAGDLHAVGVDAQRIVLGRFRREVVQVLLDRIVDIVEPSAVKLTTCSDSPLLTICGLTVALSNGPSVRRCRHRGWW